MPRLSLSEQHVLVLGAYGFIGAAVTRTLQAEGASVQGAVRDLAQGARILPGVPLKQADMRDLLHTQDWLGLLENVDVVVNCAGALQDNAKDDLETVHHTAIAALANACADQKISIVQISAIGAEPAASTHFLRTKAAGDQALRASGVPLWVLKPGLVIGQTDFGGTALLRMLAAVPWVQPLAYPNTPVQCVGMPDLCATVVDAIAGDLPQGTYDLVEDSPHSLSDVVRGTRQWLGFPAARFSVSLPPVMTKAVAALADGLAWFGWRSPLRSTAMTVMADGVIGDPAPYRAASGRGFSPLPDIYASLPCAREHRLTARMTLLMPMVVATLSLFWVLSGLFGLSGLSKASGVLTGAGWSAPAAMVAVVFWSLVDVVLGLAILWRKWAVRACLAQFGVAGIYMTAATITSPELWTDPLGPLVKILPAMVLSLVALPMLASR
ncbi:MULTISPECIES: SDR family oxidoreductase [unclassified Ruegeria]|uniref:SDR family oxidoreductase n=1 Tax=unclassified Ruegeria TaxID=2625375 RepID=UPI001487DB92|nr:MULTISPECIES: SDR family oxidoreductase [unclassified Ruegeria]NOD62563.1 NAD(P)H-binding protein [Ruegeria sp. HKCCD6109]